MTAEYETTINALLAENDKLIKLVDWQNDEIERLRETVRSLRVALERKQRPEAETIDGVIAWIKEDADRLAKTHAALGGKE